MDGYVLKITGGNDTEGFGMKRGVETKHRVKLLMSPGDSCFRGYNRRHGERRRKSVRGCIVSVPTVDGKSHISSLNLTIVKHGVKHIAGLSEGETTLLRGPKRSSKLSKLLHISNAKDEVIAYTKKFYDKAHLCTKSRRKNFKTVKITRLSRLIKLPKT